LCLRGPRERVHNEELDNLYCLSNIIRVIKIKNKMGEACSTYGERRDTYRGLVGKSERTRVLGRFRRDEKIILKLVFKKRDGAWTGLM
jgi:hypothetical protein